MQLSADHQLFVSDNKESRFVEQAELYAIQKGLKYNKRIQYSDGSFYRGYVNKQGKEEGVGIIKLDKGRIIAEFKEGKKHGAVKIISKDGHTFWGEYKNGLREGYGTYTWSNGESYTGQWKDSMRNGYGIDKWEDGREYTGMHSDD